MGSNPAVQAARERVEQSLARHHETLAFFDPQFVVAGGRAERSRGVPGGTGFYSLTNDAAALQAGIEWPLRPGA